ncbi:bestrophin family protein [Niabella ginsenosidivorans]|uniref:bestrophin family protein n=1 Tax=Niabella ginsenosidivorans TaxID=1176587 RepID=UPI000A97E64C|nr:bestrophin family ion channel [Niabella ginsenosidivorans]
MIAAFGWLLNYRLRHNTGTEQLSRLLTEEQLSYLEDKKYIPVMILDLLGKWISEQNRKKYIDNIVWVAMDKQLNHFSQIVGGCERISNTPLPFAYSVLLHRTVYFYCFWLPFGLVDSLGWMIPVVVLLISYTFIALDAIIQEIEEPFGEKENDLALNTICQSIEYSIFEQAQIPQEEYKPSGSYFID